MINLKFIPLVLKQVVRHPARSLLTIGGVATAMFLFMTIQAMQQGVQEATQINAQDNTLIVYREDRFCPFTSQLPEYYLPKIQKVDGVASAVPMRIAVNNCRASLDVVTFRGVPLDPFTKEYSSHFKMIDGTLEQWKKRSDAAILGKSLANRRGLNVGDRFDAAGVTSYVAGIIDSDHPQDENVAYVHLDFLQQTLDLKLGTVTQFNVKVNDPEKMDLVAQKIDELFQSSEFPTSTRSEKAFVAQVTSDIIELIDFAKNLGWACLIAVLALIVNAIILSVQGRIKEHAILQTLGYQSDLIGRLIVAEGILLALVGGILASLTAYGLMSGSKYSITMDGSSIPINMDMTMLFWGLLISTALGVTAGLVPAWQATRRPIVNCFRAV